MNLVFLTQEGGILSPFAWILGKIMNGLYEFVNLFGIQNIAICIILFTFVTKMLMLPLTIKQQKSMKLSSKMNPELTKIQAKYKGKKDAETMRKQQLEMQEVYDKYGTTPMGGCLPMLISLPILFALYRIIYAIPAYVNDIKDLYLLVANNVQQVNGYATAITEFITNNSIGIQTNEFSEIASGIISPTHLIDIFSKFNGANWDAFLTNGIFSSIATTIQESVANILHANSFIGGMNILDVPGWTFPGILIPIASVASQYVQGKLGSAAQGQTNVDNPAASSMKVMTTIMPVISGVFCTFIPIGVGIYWVASAVFQIIQQLFINKYMEKIDVDDLIEKNVAKSNKKKEKLGVVTGNRMSGVAKTQTKSIESSESNSKTVNSSAKVNPKREVANYKKSDVSYTAGSISANANLLNKKNNETSKTKPLKNSEKQNYEEIMNEESKG